MTRKEAVDILYCMVAVIQNEGYRFLAMDIESVAIDLQITKDLALLEERAIMIMPLGKRGRVRKILQSPYHARALSFAAAIVRSINE